VIGSNVVVAEEVSTLEVAVVASQVLVPEDSCVIVPTSVEADSHPAVVDAVVTSSEAAGILG
jgi:hypothetical protein